MSDVKQVKVANWGIYFLQRLKHFFNRTDYCDLTLQFQDNAQLKVHRLVLSACTEYFELLERTCEMYEDCLVMPDDLQADVVVPIINFMYTGQLEFRVELLERLYQTSQVLNLPVLTKLLESHRNEMIPKATPTHSYSAVKKFPKASDKIQKASTPSTLSTSNKRSYSKAFDNNTVYKEKKVYHPNKSYSVSVTNNNSNAYTTLSPIPDTSLPSKKFSGGDPRPSRYELPEELDQDNIFDSSFCNISYTSKPLMIHPETVRKGSSKKDRFGESSGSRKFSSGVSTVDILECKRVTKEDSIYDDGLLDHCMNEEQEMFPAPYINMKDDSPKDSSQLFDQILDQNLGPKVTIETKDNKLPSNIDHAKIISEVLKKYPHLVKSNKNIKLKILNTQGNTKTNKKQQKHTNSYIESKQQTTQKLKSGNEPDFTYETDVLDSKEAAKLIAMGAENVKGPWICLICGTPGKALHFTSYYKFRRHLVEVHNEKPVSNICEYCGLKSLKRNYLLHHLYSQHGVEPPPQYHFPKCNRCNYIALTEGFLVKHKMTHVVRNFRCNVCAMSFHTSNQLLSHIQNTGHKYSGDRKTNLQCIYCLKVFLRETNLFAHLKTHHKKEAKSDGIIEDSDEEKMPEIENKIIQNDSEKYHSIKFEPSTSYEGEYEVDLQFQIQQRSDGDIEIVSRKQHNVGANQKQKILNSGFGTPKSSPKPKPVGNQAERNEFLEDISAPEPTYEEIVMIDNNEYIMRDNQLIPRKEKDTTDDYMVSNIIKSESLQSMQPTTSMEFNNQATIEENMQQPSMIIKKPSNLGQPIQIVVSNEEEYKALMASNHPIIFDNSNSNKTLTVLTAPHETTLESASIDLDKTQSNDMMIIQEDYPLNVTETVSAENPNIVVVYSHTVNDPNKQYQIITSQGIGAQFVQTSAMITQNFETVTTSTPVMSAHVLENPVDETWHNNVANMETQQVEIAPEAELHAIIQSEHLEMPVIQNETTNNIHDSSIMIEPPKEIPQVIQMDEAVHQLPEENSILTPEQNTVSVSDQALITVTESHNLLQSNEPLEAHNPSTSVCTTESQNSVNTSVMATIIPNENENTKENNTFESIDTNPVAETSQDDANNENIGIMQEPMETVAEIVAETPKEIIHEDTVESALETASADQTENINLQTETPDVIISEAPQPEVQTQEYTEIPEICNEPPRKEVVEKIQNLTSEWSEDEYDIPEDQTTEIVPKLDEQSKPHEVSHDTEETIENIQQEVDKQMGTVVTTSEKTVTIESSSLDENLPIIEDSQTDDGVNIAEPETIATPADPQQNISSLLNDWEDNDSQEESTSVNNDSQEENVSVNDNELASKSTDNLPQPEQQEPIIEAQDPKTDSLKKLVSDWDDEDDEIKE